MMLLVCGRRLPDRFGGERRLLEHLLCRLSYAGIGIPECLLQQVARGSTANLAQGLHGRATHARVGIAEPIDSQSAAAPSSIPVMASIAAVRTRGSGSVSACPMTAAWSVPSASAIE